MISGHTNFFVFFPGATAALSANRRSRRVSETFSNPPPLAGPDLGPRGSRLVAIFIFKTDV